MPDWTLNPDRCAVSTEYYWRGMNTCPNDVKVLLLTQDGLCVVGRAFPLSNFCGWAPLPKKKHD